MRAVQVAAFDPQYNLSLKEVADPTPVEGEVLIKVHYAGVNFPDLLISKGLYQFKPDLPFSPGGEVAGIVEAIGEGVSGLEIGDRVLAAMGWGGFAEKAIAQASNTFKVPEGIDLKSASVLLETYATAYHALKDRAEIKDGDKILVLGASGGTGIAAVQLAKVLGNQVIAAASTQDKLELARESGADYLVDYHQSDLKESVKKLGGVDIIFDPVGGSLSEAAFRTLRPGGRHLVVGFASGHIPAIPWNLPLLKSASIVGVFWGGFWRNFPQKN
ncbi:MAG: NADPH:quinone oxidoreductase family protein, partial [Cyclobacteriaceae bacterium]|nr:NADPH:quinone oxidoreductase family protein [Cyclobacteriaceae bacterium HetDA_MAG_MS6]